MPTLSNITNDKQIIASCQSWEVENDAQGNSTYNPSNSLKEKINDVGPYFLRQLYLYLYNSYDTFESFQRARDDVEDARLAYTPVQCCNIYDIFLYINDGV